MQIAHALMTVPCMGLVVGLNRGGQDGQVKDKGKGRKTSRISRRRAKISRE